MGIRTLTHVKRQQPRQFTACPFETLRTCNACGLILRMTAPSPLHTPSLSSAIAERLRTQLVQGVWSPGQDISDAEIARSLGVSRTPVREAMKLLCHEGLLTAVPRRGMTVTVLSAAQVQEAHTLHTLLTAHLAQHGPVQGGLLSTMLHMAQQRLQLAHLTSATAQQEAPATPCN